MSANSFGSGCRSRAHADGMAIYDSLPREVRDQLKLANNSLCAGCIRNRVRREGVEATVRRLDRNRHYHKEREGREVVYVWREDLRP